MADEPENVVLKLLREMRGMLDDDGQRLRRIENRVEELQDSVVTGLGLAAHANARHDTAEKRLIDLTQRVERLETRV